MHDGRAERLERHLGQGAPCGRERRQAPLSLSIRGDGLSSRAHRAHADVGRRQRRLRLRAHQVKSLRVQGLLGPHGGWPGSLATSRVDRGRRPRARSLGSLCRLYHSPLRRHDHRPGHRASGDRAGDAQGIDLLQHVFDDAAERFRRARRRGGRRAAHRAGASRPGVSRAERLHRVPRRLGQRDAHGGRASQQPLRRDGRGRDLLADDDDVDQPCAPRGHGAERDVRRRLARRLALRGKRAPERDRRPEGGRPRFDGTHGRRALRDATRATPSPAPGSRPAP